MQPTVLQTFLQRLSKLPGLGPRSGRRLGLHLLKERDTVFLPLIRAFDEVSKAICTCSCCGNLDVTPLCSLCQDPKRDPRLLCIIADVDDLWALERTGAYKGSYHVLGGVLSALNGVTPAQLQIESLITRLKKDTPTEIILALSPTVEGQTTAHYLQDKIAPFFQGHITRLAHGVPLGGELDYLDDGTIHAALKARVHI